MSPAAGAIIFSHMSGTDLFGLIVSIIICGYLLYALLRGEKF
jgi:K+-transporting ATPase KdpF subunit